MVSIDIPFYIAHSPRVKGLSESASLLSWTGPIDGYYNVEMGINGVKAIPFSFPASHLDKIATEDALGQYLERQARTLIDRYGDARNPKPEAIISEAEQLVYQQVTGG